MEEKKKRLSFADLPLKEKKELAKKCFDITIECKFSGSKIKENYSHIANEQTILKIAKFYITYFSTATEKLLYLDTKKEYDELAKSNGIFYKLDTMYQQHVRAIVEIDDMEELEKYIKGNNPFNKEVNLNTLKETIENSSRALGDKDGLYQRAKNKLNIYRKYKYEKRQEQNKNKSKYTLKENIYLSRLTLKHFLDSEYIYKQDYCENTKLSTNVFDKKVGFVREYDEDFYNEYKNKLNEKQKNYYESLKTVVEDILYNIDNNNSYDIIDYYLKYKDEYKFNDLSLSCKNHFNNEDLKKLKIFLTKADVKSRISYDSFLNEMYTAYNHEFTKEEKEQIYNYAKENKIPFNGQNVSLMVKKYYNSKTNDDNNNTIVYSEQREQVVENKNAKKVA